MRGHVAGLELAVRVPVLVSPLRVSLSRRRREEWPTVLYKQSRVRRVHPSIQFPIAMHRAKLTPIIDRHADVRNLSAVMRFSLLFLPRRAGDVVRLHALARGLCLLLLLLAVCVCGRGYAEGYLGRGHGVEWDENKKINN